MKMLLIFLISFLPLKNSFSSGDEIRWQESRKLTFTDFKGNVPAVTPWAATTSSVISFSYETLNGKLTKVVTHASFDPQKSWMKKKSPEVLAHEQLHFDITEVFTRKLYHDIVEKNSADKKELTNLFQQKNKECEEMQQQYDDETDHGTIEEAQAKWKEKIAAMLQSEEPYPSQQ
jgi:hypothetical protein